MRSRFFTIATFFVLFVTPCYGQITAEGYVKYERSDGSYSDYYYRDELVFITGPRLNDRTNTSDYNSFSDYALVWFDQDKVAIIELSQKIQNGGARMTGDRISEFLFNFQKGLNQNHFDGEDQNGTEWVLCFQESKHYCR